MKAFVTWSCLVLFGVVLCGCGTGKISIKDQNAFHQNSISPLPLLEVETDHSAVRGDFGIIGAAIMKAAEDPSTQYIVRLNLEMANQINVGIVGNQNIKETPPEYVMKELKDGYVKHVASKPGVTSMLGLRASIKLRFYPVWFNYGQWMPVSWQIVRQDNGEIVAELDTESKTSEFTQHWPNSRDENLGPVFKKLLADNISQLNEQLKTSRK